MDVPTMLSNMAEAGYRYNTLRCGTGLTAVLEAYNFFLAFREKQSEGLAAHSPSKEKETEKDDASEKEEEIACGRYVFMLFTFCVGVINIIFLGSQLRKRVTAVPKTLYVMNTAVCSMLLLLVSFYISVYPKKKQLFHLPKSQKRM
jgi:anaerobic C4-dicarboxylate transporter